MITRSGGFYLALFACAYAGFFFASKPASVQLQAAPRTTAHLAKASQTYRASPPLAGDVSGHDELATVPLAHEPGDPPPTGSPEQQAAAQELSAQATGAEESEDRLAAMQNLSVLKGPLVVPTLQQVLRQSTDVRERLRAVAILQQLGDQGDSNGQIEALLRDAASDADEHVAAIARDAWEHLSRR